MMLEVKPQSLRPIEPLVIREKGVFPEWLVKMVKMKKNYGGELSHFASYLPS